MIVFIMNHNAKQKFGINCVMGPGQLACTLTDLMGPTLTDLMGPWN